MKQLLVIFFLLNLFNLHGQEVEMSVFSSGGGETYISGIYVGHTIGESIIETISEGNIIITQGFHQPSVPTTGVVIKKIEEKVNLSVFPNPTIDKVSIVIDDFDNTTYNISLHDFQGRKVSNSLNTSLGISFVELNLESYTRGIYFISLENNKTKKTQTAKIIKL
jgi:hypothetical protein